MIDFTEAIARRATIAALLVVAACSSAPSIVQSNTYVNQPGDPIEISVEGVNVDQRVIEGRDQPFSLGVVVANNSDLDVTVTNVNVFQNSVGPLIVDPFNASFDVTIEPAKEHAFDVRMIARRASEKSAMFSDAAPVMALRIIVTLSNGDRYMQQFEIPMSAR
jgi:hypothetical protein